jgi:hypothetical protein
LSTVQLVDLATGACVPQDNLLQPRLFSEAGRLPDGRIVCAGGIAVDRTAEVWGPPAQGAADAAWSWTELPAMSVARRGCCGCVLSDGRFAVLGGRTLTSASGPIVNTEALSSCEALIIGDGVAHWDPLPDMHDAREGFACGVVAPGSVIVAGGIGLKSAELYDAKLNRWLRLPRDLPYVGDRFGTGSAVV